MKKLNLLHIKIALLSWFICFALVRLTQISTANPVSFVFFIACILGLKTYYSKIDTSSVNKGYIFNSLIISSVFSIFTTFGGFIAITSGLENLKFKLLVSIFSFLGFWIMYFFLVLAFLIISEKWSISDSIISSHKNINLSLLAFIICTICWLPALFTNYPGIMTIDSINQYGQAINALPLSNHHPYFHTLIIKACITVGNFLGSYSIGIAIYSILQIIISAFIVAFLVNTLVRIQVKPWIIYSIIGFFSLIPYNGYMMVTVWKDILFSMSLLLLSTCLFRLCLLETIDSDCKFSTYIFYVLSGIGVGLLRSNGFYIIVVIIPITLLLYRKKIIKLCILNSILLLSVLIVKYPVYKTLNVAEPDFVENLSIPLQTMGRVFVEGVASEYEYQEWNKYLDVTAIPEYYYANVSDNMKALAKSGQPDYLNSHKADFIKLWIATGIKHPVQYVFAWGDITKGYWYPDTLPENPIAGDEGIIPNDYSLYASPIIKGGLFVKIKEVVFKLPYLLPIWGLFFSIGAFVWFMILMSGKILSGKRKIFFVCLLPSFLYLLTVILAIPVGCEFRYGYEFIVCSPLYLCVAFFKN